MVPVLPSIPFSPPISRWTLGAGNPSLVVSSTEGAVCPLAVSDPTMRRTDSTAAAQKICTVRRGCVEAVNVNITALSYLGSRSFGGEFVFARVWTAERETATRKKDGFGLNLFRRVATTAMYVRRLYQTTESRVRSRRWVAIAAAVGAGS